MVALLIGLGANALRQGIQNGNSGLETTAGLVGTSISALFLFAMGIINIVILVQIVRAFRQVTRGGSYNEEAVEAVLNQRGFLARIFRGLFKSIDTSWKMYPVGIPLRPRVRHRDRGSVFSSSPALSASTMFLFTPPSCCRSCLRPA